MKKIINVIRDFLYTITDYGLILTVVVIMVAVLAWRFDILFNRDIEKETIASIPYTIKTEDTIIDNPTNSDDSSEIPELSEKNPDGTPEIPAKENDLVAIIEIPSGSFPSKIGEILLDSKLISDKNEFLNKSVEMGLDTKLQSGIFEISVGTNLDDIIKILAKSN